MQPSLALEDFATARRDALARRRSEHEHRLQERMHAQNLPMNLLPPPPANKEALESSGRGRNESEVRGQKRKRAGEARTVAHISKSDGPSPSQSGNVSLLSQAVVRGTLQEENATACEGPVQSTCFNLLTRLIEEFRWSLMYAVTKICDCSL